jgi:hypothetical protein
MPGQDSPDGLPRIDVLATGRGTSLDATSADHGVSMILPTEFADEVAFHFGCHRRDHEEHFVGDGGAGGAAYSGADAGEFVEAVVDGGEPGGQFPALAGRWLSTQVAAVRR